MRTLLLFLVGFLLQPAISVAFGEEPLLVRVLSLDEASGKLSGRMLDGPSEGVGNKETQDIIVRMTSGPLPKGIRPGDVIRIWGGFSGKSQNFLAGRLSSAIKGGKKDPTGVRRRLGKGRRVSGTKGSARGGHGRK